MNAQGEWRGEGGFAGRGADGEPLGVRGWVVLVVVASAAVMLAGMAWCEARSMRPAPAESAAEPAGGAR